MFDYALVRFGTSGILIALFGLFDGLARMLGSRPPSALVKRPIWMHLTMFTSVLAFYGLIGPKGGALLGGKGNVYGIILVMAACAMRFLTRKGAGRIRFPEIASRMVFYAALPLAVGVPWGWLALTAPAAITSIWWTQRADRVLAERDPAHRAWMARSNRWVPGIW